MKEKNKKQFDIFNLTKNLTLTELKIYSVLNQLTEKNGYTFITMKNLAKRLELSEKDTVSSLYNLVKKNALYFIDIKDKTTNKTLEKRFYTNKFKYFRDWRNKEKLEPTFLKLKEEKLKEEKEIYSKEEREKLEANKVKVNSLTDEYFENMDMLEYTSKYDEAEERYKKLMNTDELNSFQRNIFEKTVEIYIKEIIKEEIAKMLGIEDEITTCFQDKKKINEIKNIDNIENSWDKKIINEELYR